MPLLLYFACHWYYNHLMALNWMLLMGVLVGSLVWGGHACRDKYHLPLDLELSFKKVPYKVPYIYDVQTKVLRI